MSDLAIELLLILLLATFIGWFLGRFLSKNKEHEERSHNRQLSQQILLLETEQKNLQQTLIECHEKLNETSKVEAGLKQSCSSFETRLDSLQEERKRLIHEHQALEISHARLESISNEFEQNKRQMQSMKSLNTEQENEIVSTQSALNRTSKTLSSAQTQVSQQRQQLDVMQQENSKQAAYIFELEKDRQALQSLTIDHDVSLSKNTILEEDKVRFHERYAELKKEQIDLRQQCDTLRTESMQFNSRFSTLMEEKEDISHEAERLTIEKNDYLGRLRAISGVIDVVGTEKLVDDSMPSQEFIPRQTTIIR
ncbi:hypothetical protein [Leucothrix arctica]|uniref:Uncharacterized protein n=1 Tax=Leucothrix arctica TaxID=1481894 RepID=A0A317CP32_9GAMM|nr:hypothetical protein [Leucothrix arctica]PWQ99253.1 hypothetical protein DKT75_01525 [Leucothrix arctica]